MHNVGRQIRFLQQIIDGGVLNGYVFNVNTLLQESATEAYMVILAPSTSTHKDIYIQDKDDDGRELAMFSDRLQMGIRFRAEN